MDAYKIVNNFENDSFVVEEWTTNFNDKTASDSVVFTNHSNREVYFLNGKIASDFLERYKKIKEESKGKVDLKKVSFEVFFLVAQREEKTFKQIRGINIVGEKEGISFQY